LEWGYFSAVSPICSYPVPGSVRSRKKQSVIEDSAFKKMIVRFSASLPTQKGISNGAIFSNVKVEDMN